jgi:hypothetical protein
MMGIVLMFLSGCKKDDAPLETNQLLIDQMRSVTDSIVKNTHVPGIVALVVDILYGTNF